MTAIPSNNRFDSFPHFVRTGFEFIKSECDRLQTDVFSTRFFGAKTICMRGPEAARLFYDESRFERAGVMPARLQKTLFGVGGVQGLDGEAHQHRKEMLLSLMSEEHITSLSNLMLEQFAKQLPRWEEQEQIEVLDAMHRVLTYAVLEWCGIDTSREDMDQVASFQTSMVDGSGGLGPRFWRARIARKQADAWARKRVLETRAGLIKPPEESALSVIAHHRDLQGEVLHEDVAAVELLNITRPSIACGRWIMFAIHAMHTSPAAYDDLRANTDLEAADRFGEEVRRFYPFFPFVAARTRSNFEWDGYEFPRETRVLLDLYATLHHEDHWVNPDMFLPDRFFEDIDRKYLMIPHGGGDYSINHRCAGEHIARRLLRDAVRYIADHVAFEVPEQDLSISLTRIPPEPQDRMLLTNVRRRNLVDAPAYVS